MNCLFCKIINGDIPSSKVYEDDMILAFNDIAPMAPVHVLVIPKEHIANVDGITEENSKYVSHIFEKIPEIAKGDYRKFILEGLFSGVCPVSVETEKADENPFIRLEFVKRYK
jgi:diadenosine tetraphosphate (Ap4A) HIT family hydrolase